MCPMCQAAIQLEVCWRLPLPFRRRNPPGEGEGDPHADEAAGLLPHQREVQRLLHDIPQILPADHLPAAAMAPMQWAGHDMGGRGEAGGGAP